MFTRDFVVNALSHIKDSVSEKPIIIEGVSGNEEKRHINVKVAITKTSNDKKQEIEAQIIYKLRKEGAATVGVLFTELPEVVKPKEDTILTSSHRPEFIAIASGKGGVGKSTVTVNLAVALARLGKRVGIVDADIYGPSIPNMMGVDEKPLLQDEKIIPVVKHGVKVISMKFFKENDDPVMWRGPMLGRMIDVFLNQVRWGILDYLIFDLPPGTGDVALDISSRIPTCKEIVVTTPHPTASYIAKQAGVMAIKTNHEILGIIENMAYIEIDNKKHYVFGSGGGEDLAKELGTKVLGSIPMGQPKDLKASPSVYEDNSEIANIYKQIAENLI
ncbi:MAG: Mrp/NBP35 family ATP-binding protein [Defluviitaleaceae bacterium]|nr:Mrp/NBP35 family ATP-binding protein [Defluviitaleaceae bacterium]